MAITRKEIKNKEENFQSRYDENRPCYRASETEYVYLEELPTRIGEPRRFIRHVIKAGENGVSPMILDCLQALDNEEVQNQEDDRRLRVALAEHEKLHAGSNEEDVSILTENFHKHVMPHLTEEQQELMYSIYGMYMTQREIADKSHSKDDGAPVSPQAVFHRVKRLHAKTRKHMPQD